MSKNEKVTENKEQKEQTEQKVMTKYDRKVQKRKEEKEKEKEGLLPWKFHFPGRQGRNDGFREKPSCQIQKKAADEDHRRCGR